MCVQDEGGHSANVIRTFSALTRAHHMITMYLEERYSAVTTEICHKGENLLSFFVSLTANKEISGTLC
jgi:hypothetical protein